MAAELILIAEDYARNRKLMRDVLRFKPCHAIEVQTAHGANFIHSGT